MRPGIAFIPTVSNGRMHLGHLRTYLVAWIMSKIKRERLVVMMENCRRWSCGRLEHAWLLDMTELGLLPDEIILDRRWENAIGRHHDGQAIRYRGGDEPEPDLAYSVGSTGEVRCPFPIPDRCLQFMYPCSCPMTPKNFYQYPLDPCAGRIGMNGKAATVMRLHDPVGLHPIVGWKDGLSVYWANQAWMRKQLQQHHIETVVRGTDLREYFLYQEVVAHVLGWPAVATVFVGLVMGRDGKPLGKSTGAMELRQIPATHRRRLVLAMMEDLSADPLETDRPLYEAERFRVRSDLDSPVDADRLLAEIPGR